MRHELFEHPLPERRFVLAGALDVDALLLVGASLVGETYVVSAKVIDVREMAVLHRLVLKATEEDLIATVERAVAGVARRARQ